jgi:asparaginase (EC 3.5.1.1)
VAPRSPRLLLHGGAGALAADHRDLPAQRAALAAITGDGLRRLDNGEDAQIVVVEAVAALEDCPLFNAGRGGVLNREGRVEMDAAVMIGRDRRAGAVAAVTRPRNPVRLAAALLDAGVHLLMAGDGANRLAEQLGLPCEPPEYFITDTRRAQLGAALRAGRVRLDHDDEVHGTVGAVARDRKGQLAAATSTGGMTAKQAGRVGDSPVIGAGTLADDRSLAISCTGTGEAFIRLGFAHQVDARMRLTGASLAAACRTTLAELAALGGAGGCIAVDHRGRVFAGANTPALLRAWSDARGGIHTAALADEPFPQGA